MFLLTFCKIWSNGAKLHLSTKTEIRNKFTKITRLTLLLIIIIICHGNAKLLKNARFFENKSECQKEKSHNNHVILKQ